MKAKVGVLLGLGLAGGALLAATALQARGPKAQEPVPARTPLPRAAVTAEGRVVTYDGADVIVSAERGGRLISVRVIENERVRKGQVLAEIDSEELRASLAEARATIREVESNLGLAEINANRRRELAREGIVAAHDLDTAVHELGTLRARRETAQATAERYESQLRKMRILSPIDGVVVSRDIEPGETVVAGQRAFAIADTSKLRVTGEADEADAGALRVGAPVIITSDAYPGRHFPGHVETVSDAVTLRKLKAEDPARPTDTRVIGMKVAFDEANPLKLGTTVELRIETP